MLREDIDAFLRQLTDEQLDNGLPEAVQEEWTRRLNEQLKPGMLVRTIMSGFSGGPGRVCVFQGFVQKGDTTGDYWYGGDYARFGTSLKAETMWLCEPAALGRMIRIVERK